MILNKDKVFNSLYSFLFSKSFKNGGLETDRSVIRSMYHSSKRPKPQHPHWVASNSLGFSSRALLTLLTPADTYTNMVHTHIHPGTSISVNIKTRKSDMIGTETVP